MSLIKRCQNKQDGTDVPRLCAQLVQQPLLAAATARDSAILDFEKYSIHLTSGFVQLPTWPGCLCHVEQAQVC